jgi:hypothetical protein
MKKRKPTNQSRTLFIHTLHHGIFEGLPETWYRDDSWSGSIRVAELQGSLKAQHSVSHCVWVSASKTYEYDDYLSNVKVIIGPSSLLFYFLYDEAWVGLLRGRLWRHVFNRRKDRGFDLLTPRYTSRQLAAYVGPFQVYWAGHPVIR